LPQLPVTLQRSARGRIARDQARVVEKNMRHPAGRHSTKLRIQLDPATSGTRRGVGAGIMALHKRYLQTAATDLWTTNNKLDGPHVFPVSLRQADERVGRVLAYVHFAYDILNFYRITS